MGKKKSKKDTETTAKQTAANDDAPEETLNVSDFLATKKKDNNNEINNEITGSSIEGRDEQGDGGDDELEYDLGNICVFDDQPINDTDISKDKEGTLFNLASRNFQKLINQMFNNVEIETDQTEGSAFVLPYPTSRIPREKPVPVNLGLTKWEAYAREKGIGGKRKKERMVWDEQMEEWRPSFGYKKAGKDSKNGDDVWLMEEKPGDNFGKDSDPFLERKKEKKEKIAKQKERENRNTERLSKSNKSKLPTSVALTNTPSFTDGSNSRRSFKDKSHLKTAATTVATSTASMGKFDTRRKDEPKRPKGAGPGGAGATGRKSRLAVTGEIKEEKDRSHRVLDSMFGAGSAPKLNMERAAKVANIDEERANRESNQKKAIKGRKRKNLQDATRDKGLMKKSRAPAK